MLGFIRGQIVSKNEESSQCVVVAGQVGYEITVSRAELGAASLGSEVSFWLHTHVREDILALFGFSSDLEKQFFRILLMVSGLGPKTAMALLAEHGVHRLVRLVIEKNYPEIAKAPGVGKRLAERVVLELSGKLEKLAFFKNVDSKALAGGTLRDKPLREDLYSALVNLGYPAHTVRATLDLAFEQAEFTDFEVALRSMLKEMYRRET